MSNDDSQPEQLRDDRGVPSSLAHALARALLDDPRGIVSERNARRIVAVGLAQIAVAEDPNHELVHAHKVIAAAKLLVGDDRDATEILESFDSRAREAVARRLAELAGRPSGASALAERVLAALRHSFGADGGVTVTDIEHVDGRTFATIANLSPLGPLTARVELSEDSEGEPAIAAVEIILAPPLIDPALKQSLETTLAEQFGYQDPIVEGLATTNHAGASEHHLLVRSDAGRRGIHLWIPDEGLPSLGSYRFDEQQFREQALPLMVGQALEIAAQIGPAAELEVYLRGSTLTPESLEHVTDPDESAVGFGPGEVQLFAPALLGDVGVYVTIDRDTGEYRVEDFN